MAPPRVDKQGRTVHEHRVRLEVRRLPREELRRAIVEAWLREAPGTPTERHTYRYDVETLSDGSRIFLTRPARINKGMDFVITCEGFNLYKNGNPKPPGHTTMYGAIGNAVRDARGRVNAPKLKALHEGIRRVWNCEEPDDVLASMPTLRGDLAAERILKLVKWLFIEQDLTYWTESGRHKFMGGIEETVAQLREEA